MSYATQIRAILIKHAPMILTATGVAGVITTAVLAAKAGSEANNVLRRKEVVENRNLTKKEVFKATWKLYIPTSISSLATIGTVVASHRLNTNRQAALLGLYTATDAALRKYKGKVEEIVGSNNERKIRESIQQDTIDAKPKSKQEVFITGKGDMLCYDEPSGRYFMGDIEKIRQIQNDINQAVIHQDYIPLNALYSALGLNNTTLGDLFGWNTDRLLDINFSTMLSEDKTPCIVLEYQMKHGYYDNHR